MEITNIEPVNQKPNLPPKTWLTESILVTILCCWPLGIPAIVNASKVESRFYAGDHTSAERYSREAGKWTKIAFWSGLIVGILYIILMAVAVILEEI